MKRGDIYFIANTNNCGAEIGKSRPAVIVSNDTLNATSDVVEVVYLTTQPKREMFTHVEINATGRQSTVLCEQISAVSKSRVGDFCGRCSERNMADIDRALTASLGLTVEEQEEQDNHNITVNVSGMAKYTEMLIRAETERDVYKRLYEQILGQVCDE
jgi:mRNA interferase MazF